MNHGGCPSVCLSVCPGLRNSTPPHPPASLLLTSVNRRRVETRVFFFTCVNIVRRAEGCQRANLGAVRAAWVGLRFSFRSTRLTSIRSGERLSDARHPAWTFIQKAVKNLKDSGSENLPNAAFRAFYQDCLVF